MKQYTTKELMEGFGISRYAVHRATKSGELPSAGKRGVEVIYNESDVLNYLDASAQKHKGEQHG